MTNCYLCDAELINVNVSKEHILLNAIGGQLKSSTLLCKKCNSGLGHEADKELANQLSFLSSYLCVKRDNGNNQIIKGAESKEGKKYDIIRGSKPVPSNPTFEKKTDNGKVNYNISARSEKELINILKGLQKKHPELDLEQAKQKFKWREEYLSEPLKIDTTIGGDIAFKSIAKSAINYYIYSQNDKNEVKHLFNYLKGTQELQIAKHYYPLTPIYKQEEKEIIHLIHLVGESENKLLYCFIELFSAYSFIVLLSNNFQGKNFISTYCYDLIQNIVIDKEVSIKLSKDELEQIILMTKNDFEAIQKKVGRVMQINSRIQTDREIDNLIGKTIESVFNKKYNGQTIVTEEMLSDFSREVALAYVKFAYRGKDLGQQNK